MASNRKRIKGVKKSPRSTARPAASRSPQPQPPHFTPELRDRIDGLSLTWPLCEKLGKVTIKESEIPEGSAWEFKLEDRFGDEYTERGRTLKTFPLRHYDLFWRLTRLTESEGKDPEATCVILEEAKKAASLAAIQSCGIDWRRRQVANYTRLQKQLVKQRAAVRRLTQRELLGPDDSESVERERQLTEAFDAFHADTILGTLKKSPLRRPKAGRQPQPWIDEARRKLADLGLFREDADALLMDVGLLPFSPSRLVGSPNPSAS